MSETTYYQKNRKEILNRTKKYYNGNIEALREKARNNYWYLSDDEANKKREYGTNKHPNISEEDKQKLKECQKNHRESKSSTSFFLFVFVFIV